MTYPIVIPLHPRGGKFRDNSELRFAIRSLKAHFKDPYQVVIVGPKMPDWLQGASHLKQTDGGLKTALVMAAAAHPGGFFWFYDDVCLLKDTTAAQMKVTPCCRGWSKANTGWSRSLDQIKERLTTEGHKPWDYSRPHGPYWFDKSMVDEAFADWPGMKSKFPFESWILSKRDWPRDFGPRSQSYGAFRVPQTESRYLNYNDNGSTPELRAWLEQRFPAASRFENVPTLAPAEQSAGQPTRILFTCHQGCDERIWQWCGPGIKAFARSHRADLIELPKCLDANPQWVLFDAFKASLSYPDSHEFAWVDSDLVIAYPATDIWSSYPKMLHVCKNAASFKNNLKARMALPDSVPNNCTGIVKWNRAEAEKLSAWYDANKHRFPASDGDQELLAVAYHEAGITPSWFHPRMHVAGAKPPPRTAFKHKGGKSKIKWIPKFLAANQKLGLVAPENKTASVFGAIYHEHKWSGDSRSGVGSSLSNTENIRRELPKLFSDLGVRSLIDCPCGDWHWMREMDLKGVSYLGVDVVPDIVKQNTDQHAKDAVSFMLADVTRDLLPQSDMVLVRDCFGHLPEAEIFRALWLLKASGTSWLALTTFPGAPPSDTKHGGWRRIDFSHPRFCLKQPVEMIEEVEAGKFLGIYQLNP